VADPKKDAPPVRVTEPRLFVPGETIHMVSFALCMLCMLMRDNHLSALITYLFMASATYTIKMLYCAIPDSVILLS